MQPQRENPTGFRRGSVKKIILLLLVLLSLQIASAYIIVDYDTMDYAASGQAQMEARGWFAESGNSDPDSTIYNCCSINDGELQCVCGYDAGTDEFLIKKWNNVAEGYSIQATPSLPANNFSMRFAYKRNCITPEPYYIQYAFLSFWNSLIFDNLQAQLNFMIVTGSGADVYQYRANTNSGVSKGLFEAQCGSYHEFQIDYILETLNITSGGDFVPRNMSLWSKGTSGLWNNTNVSYGINAALFGGINLTYINTAPTFASAINFSLDNLSIIVYDYGEGFVDPTTTLNITINVNCSDGIDNDNDSYIDYPDEPQCDSALDNSEEPFDTHECNDGIDNDGDSFIDYPFDISCDSSIDDTESIFDYTQCNDGNDNDDDGLIDYPNDPSCTGFNDNTENQSDFSIQLSDVCLVTQGCYFLETTPYTDSIYLHGWVDYFGNEIVNGYPIQGSNSIRLKTIYDSFIYNFAIAKPFQNSAAAQTSLNFDIIMSFDDEVCPDLSCGTNQSFYMLLNSGNSTSVALKFEVLSQANQVKIYYVHPNTSQTLLQTESPSFGAFQKLDLSYNLDLLTKKFNYGSISLPFYTNTTPDNVRIQSISYNNLDIETYIHSLYIHSPLTSSLCTDFAPPYYLREQFYSSELDDCGWNTAPQGFRVNGNLRATNDVSYLTIYKGFYDTEESSYVILDNQYSTFTFDFIPYSTSSSSTIFTFNLWDLNSNFLSFIFKRDGTLISPVQSGTISSLNMNSVNSFKLVTNLNQDKYDLYINSVQVKSAEDFDDYAEDVQEISQVFIQSSSSSYIIDNLSVFTSDSEGNPLLIITPNTGNLNNGTFWNGLFYMDAPLCTQDSDCQSGVCSKLNTCARFNFKTCDKYKMNRDSWCVVSNMVRYGMLWVSDVILDNFELFLMVLVLLMGLVYLSIMLRKKGG